VVGAVGAADELAHVNSARPRESGDPGSRVHTVKNWTPAFAGERSVLLEIPDSRFAASGMAAYAATCSFGGLVTAIGAVRFFVE
jgi:hypothetical protein